MQFVLCYPPCFPNLEHLGYKLLIACFLNMVGNGVCMKSTVITRKIINELKLKIKKEMENFGKFMTIVLAMIITPIINGFVFCKLWMWFIVPTFDANPIRMVEAIGIIVLINFIRVKHEDTKSEDFWENFGKKMMFVIMSGCFALLIGWIVKLFM